MSEQSAEYVAPQARCLHCPRTVAVVPWKGFMVVARHDNRNNSGFCKGSLEPLCLDDAWENDEPCVCATEFTCLASTHVNAGEDLGDSGVSHPSSSGDGPQC